VGVEASYGWRRSTAEWSRPITRRRRCTARSDRTCDTGA